jgi:hypothetical protein
MSKPAWTELSALGADDLSTVVGGNRVSHDPVAPKKKKKTAAVTTKKTNPEHKQGDGTRTGIELAASLAGAIGTISKGAQAAGVGPGLISPIMPWIMGNAKQMEPDA